MPSPVTPAQFCAAIPAANADLCTRLTRFFNVVSLLCDFFTYFLKDTGAISDIAIAEITASATPTGTYMWNAGTNVGTGWLLCNGAAVSRTTYAALFTLIGTRYGAGDGSTTFNLPDGRSRSLMAAGQGSGLSNRDINTKYVGEENHLQVIGEMPVHHHSILSHSAGATGGDGGDILNEPDPATEHSHDTDDTGGGTAFNVIHPCLISYLFIKT
jgi:microcystin-dependent protein